MAMCATFDLQLEQLNVKIAFLHGDLEEKVYMLLREDLKKKGKKELGLQVE